jgi:hypothetical protein
MIPNITENPRHRKTPKRGRERLFNEAIHTLRDRVERTFAWREKGFRKELSIDLSPAQIVVSQR